MVMETQQEVEHAKGEGFHAGYFSTCDSIAHAHLGTGIVWDAERLGILGADNS